MPARQPFASPFRCGLCRLSTFALLLAAAPCLAQAPTEAPRQVQFHWRPAAAGEEVQQHVDFTLDLKMTIEQAGQVVGSNERGMQRVQQRQVTVLETGEHGASAVEVHFDQARQTLVDGGQAAPAVNQPVAGKTYRVARRGEKIEVTYADGSPPTDEERQIVTASMDALGRPNPIARFFDGRTLAVGERVELPLELARELLGLDATLGQVTRIDMRLADVQSVHGAPCAVFDIGIAARSTDATTMTVEMKGRLLLAVDSCRSVLADLSGPVTLAEGRGPAAGHFTVQSAGTMRMAVESQYRRR